MKKAILFILTILTLSCSGDTSHPDALIGKWFIYRAEYEHAVYDYEINGQCGSQALEMLTNTFVTETFYTNADCSGFTSSSIGIWVNEGNGVYNIYPAGQTVPERTLILTDDEIKVTEPGFITVIKYYRRAI